MKLALPLFLAETELRNVTLQKMSLPVTSAAIQPTSARFTTVIHENDVLLGRGVPVFTYPGNVRFRQLVTERKGRYTSSCRHQVKSDISREIISIVLERGGRFVREVKTSAEWEALGIPKGTKAYVFVDDTTIEQKVKQALREPDSSSAQNDNDTVHANAKVIVATKTNDIQSGDISDQPPASVPRATDQVVRARSGMQHFQASPTSSDSLPVDMSYSFQATTGLQSSANRNPYQSSHLSLDAQLQELQQQLNTVRSQSLNQGLNNLTMASQSFAISQQNDCLRRYLQQYGTTALGLTDIPRQSHSLTSLLSTDQITQLRHTPTRPLRPPLTPGLNPPFVNVMASEFPFNNNVQFDRFAHQPADSDMTRASHPSLMQPFPFDTAAHILHSPSTSTTTPFGTSPVSSRHESKMSDVSPLSNLNEQQLTQLLRLSQESGRKRKASEEDVPFRRHFSRK